jgi:hypothetical protein
MKLPKQSENVDRSTSGVKAEETKGIVPQVCLCGPTGRVIEEGGTGCCGGTLYTCMLGVMGATNIRC